MMKVMVCLSKEVVVKEMVEHPAAREAAWAGTVARKIDKAATLEETTMADAVIVATPTAVEMVEATFARLVATQTVSGARDRLKRWLSMTATVAGGGETATGMGENRGDDGSRGA